MDLSLAILPQVHGLPERVGLLVLSILLNGVAAAAYIGAGLGPGPCDGLMTGLCARTGWSTSELSARLLELELEDQVARLPGGLYQRRGHA